MPLTAINGHLALLHRPAEPWWPVDVGGSA
jgi:hypothetical protein